MEAGFTLFPRTSVTPATAICIPKPDVERPAWACGWPPVRPTSQWPYRKASALTPAGRAQGAVAAAQAVVVAAAAADAAMP